MAQFIYLPKFGYIDVDDIIQIHAPNGGEVNLDKDPELAVRFGSPVFDGETLTNVVMIRNPEVIEFLVAALGLLECPHRISDVVAPDNRIHHVVDLLIQVNTRLENITKILESKK